MGLFKKSPKAIFVCEANLDAPVVTITSCDILFLSISSLFHIDAERDIPG